MHTADKKLLFAQRKK